MRELKQDWRDIFGSFRVAFDVWKLVLGFAGVVLTLLVLWGLTSIPNDAPKAAPAAAAETTSTGADDESGGGVAETPAKSVLRPMAGWLIPIIVSAILLLSLLVKFASSDTGFSTSKILMMAVSVALLAGLIALCMFTDVANAWGRTAGIAFVVLMIWAYFGGAISRIAAVEIANDDRIGLGEAGRFACRKYGAFLGATVLPGIAVLFLALCCALFGVLFRVPYLNFFVTLLFFFLIPLAGFLMFLVGLGGVIGAPLMYPAVSSEANDSFDAISRAYSYVFGRPWRYIFFNAAGAVYGLACSFFVAFFVKYMLFVSFSGIDYGTGGYFARTITPVRKEFLRPLNNAIVELVGRVGGWVKDWDVTGYLVNAFNTACRQLGLAATEPHDLINLNWAEYGAALIIAVVVYAIIGLVIAYIVSLFFSIQTTIYLLLRKSVDGAEMTEVYREEDEETFAAAPEAEKKDEAATEEKKES